MKMPRSHLKLDKTDFAAAERILLPKTVRDVDFRIFFRGYLALNNAHLIERNNEQRIADFKEYDSLWMTDVAEAQKRSLIEHKPLLVFFTWEPCKPCDEFRKDSFASAKVFEELHAYVLLRIVSDGSDFIPDPAKINAPPGFAKALGLKQIGFPKIVLIDGARKDIMDGYDPGAWDELWGRLFNFRRATH